MGAGREFAMPDENQADPGEARHSAPAEGLTLRAVPSGRGLARRPASLTAAVATVQAVKPYPQNYLPAWVQPPGSRLLLGGIAGTSATVAEEPATRPRQGGELAMYRGEGSTGWVYGPRNWPAVTQPPRPPVLVGVPPWAEAAGHTAEEVAHIAHLLDCGAEVWDVAPDYASEGARHVVHSLAVVAGVLLTAWAKARKLLA
jgi:hypothetical protein